MERFQINLHCKQKHTHTGEESSYFRSQKRSLFSCLGWDAVQFFTSSKRNMQRVISHTHIWKKKKKGENVLASFEKCDVSPSFSQTYLFCEHVQTSARSICRKYQRQKISFPPSLFSPNLPNRLTQQLISPSVFSIFGLFKYSHFFCCPPNSHEKEGLKKKFPWQAVRRFPQKSTLRQKKDLKKKSVIFLWGIGWWALFCAQATAKRTSQAF